MKKFYFWSLFVGLFLGSLTFIACGGDDEENNSNAGNASGNNPVLASQIIGTWYLTEVSAEKVLVTVINFESNGTGTFTEIKAKSKNNWVKVPKSENFNYTLTGNHVKMVLSNGAGVREGDVVMNANGTASVTPYENGQPGSPMLMQRLHNKTGDQIINELLNAQGIESISTKIIGNWETTNYNGQRERWEITETSVRRMYTYWNDNELVGSGVSGYYELGYDESQSKNFINCHWSHFMNCTDANDFTFTLGDETHRENPPIGWLFTYDAQNDVLYFDNLKEALYRK